MRNAAYVINKELELDGFDMAQYVEYTDPETGLKYRDGVRDEAYVIDKELELAGFEHDLGGGEGEDINWENVQAVI